MTSSQRAAIHVIDYETPHVRGGRRGVDRHPSVASGACAGTAQQAPAAGTAPDVRRLHAIAAAACALAVLAQTFTTYTWRGVAAALVSLAIALVFTWVLRQAAEGGR